MQVAKSKAQQREAMYKKQSAYFTVRRTQVLIINFLVKQLFKSTESQDFKLFFITELFVVFYCTDSTVQYLGFIFFIHTNLIQHTASTALAVIQAITQLQQESVKLYFSCMTTKKTVQLIRYVDFFIAYSTSSPMLSKEETISKKLKCKKC